MAAIKLEDVRNCLEFRCPGNLQQKYEAAAKIYNLPDAPAGGWTDEHRLAEWIVKNAKKPGG
jgi:hypothetical protein